MGSSDGSYPIQGILATITDLSIPGQVAGDTLYYNGSKWTRLAKGTGLLHGGTTPSYSLIVDADISGTAAVGLSKLATGALPSGITIADANVATTFSKSKISTTGTWVLADLPTGTGYLHSSGGTNGYQAITSGDVTTGLGYTPANPGGTQTWSALQTFGNNISIGGATLNITTLTSGHILQYNGTNWVNVAASSIALVSSVANSDGTLTISPTTGAVVSSINLSHANTWAALQTFGNNISIGGKQFNISTLATGDYLKYNGTNWINYARVSGDVTAELGFTPENTANKGAASGYAGLNASSKLTNSLSALSQIPALTASKALISDASGLLSASVVTSTELGYVSGVTSAIQTQLNNRVILLSNIFSTAYGAVQEYQMLHFDWAGSTNVTSTESATQITVLLNVTFQLLTVKISANAGTGNAVFFFRKNGANGNQTITVGGGLTGTFTDNTHTDSVVNGDLINTSQLGPTGGNITQTLISVRTT